MILIKNTRLKDELVDIRCAETIVEIGVDLVAGRYPVFDAQGGEVLPGLHDHHIHLFAAAQALSSVDFSDLGANQFDRFKARLSRFADGSDSWIRGVGYHEHTGGMLNAAMLDELCGPVPVRIQHASGKAWILNSQAMAELDVQNVDLPGVERDRQGRATGVLWRLDDWLREQLRAQLPSLSQLSNQLASYGVTSVTDASYSNDASSATRFAADPGLLQDVCLMGDDSLQTGHLKILLDDDALPDFDALLQRAVRAREAGRRLAFHCVSHIELVYALAILQALGAQQGDRIEHAGVVRPETLETMAKLGVTVVTQPGFIWARGDRYRVQADAADLDYIYPYASLLAAGVPIAASSDAPYGPLNPWRIIATAVDRQTQSGVTLGPQERVPPREALRGYLTHAASPGGLPRSVAVGDAADLCVLSGTWAEQLQSLATVEVQATIAAGALIYSSSANTSSECSPM